MSGNNMQFNGDNGVRGDTNYNGTNYVAWNWKAGGSGSANTDGTINSTVSTNTTAGFSIVTYTGYGSASTVGHGLGAVPKMIIVKKRSGSGYDESWYVYHEALGNTHTLGLNSTGGSSDVNVWNDTTPTSSVFSVGNDSTNRSGNEFVAYCFAEKTGYSKFGKVISNGSDDGTFSYTGFAPKWVMLKPTVSDGWSNWYIFDTTRDTNLNDKPLYANLNTREAYYGGSPATNYAQIDMLSNGFKIRRGSAWGGGGNGTELIYMAFGQSIVAVSYTHLRAHET